MNSYRWQEIRVGVFVIFSFVLLLVFLFVISGIRVGERYVSYTTKLDYVGGLEVGTPVRLGGLLVGKITRIEKPEPHSRKIGITFEVKEGTPIKTDSRAYLTSIGLMGEFYLEIVPGSPDAPLLPPGSEVTSLEATTVSQLSISLGKIADQLQITVQNLNRLLGDENQRLFRNMIEQMNTVLTRNASDFSQILTNLNHLTRGLVHLNAQIDSLLRVGGPTLAHTVRNLDSTSAAIRELAEKLNSMSESLTEMMVTNNATYQTILNNLEASSIHLQEFTRTLKEQPWSLIRKTYPPERKIK
jgi:phospholipid/cholesterol/gamma-HCH transport system substrate-binding protein